MEQQETNLDLKDVIYLLLKWWWLLAIFMVLFPAVAYFYTLYTYMPQYSAHATMVVSSKQVKVIGGQVEVDNDIGLSQKLVNTYSVILKSDHVMELVAEDLRLTLPPAELRPFVTVAPANKNTEVLVVQVKNAEPRLAANICNSIMKVAPQAIADTVEVGSVNVLDYAKVPAYPQPPLTARNTTVGALLGFMFGAGLIMLIWFFDNTVKNGDLLQNKLGLNFLGGIPYVRELDNATPLTITAAPSRRYSRRLTFGFVEAYKALRTNLRYVTLVSDAKKLLLASARHGEGKSTTAVNLAIALAQSGKTVLVIDCDLRSPSIHRIADLQIEEGRDLAGVLLGKVQAQEAIVEMRSTGVALLPAGADVANPSELLGSSRMGQLLAALEKDYDYILMDTPPATLFADALALAGHCDGVIFVVKQSYTRVNTIFSVAEDFKQVKVPILGCILNSIKYKEAGTWHKYRDYGGYLSDYYREYGLVSGVAGAGRRGGPVGLKKVLLRTATSKWVCLPLIFVGLFLISMALWDYLLPVYHISKLAAGPTLVSPVDDSLGRGAATPVEYPAFGEQYATLLLPSVGVSRPVFFGDTRSQLRAGVGHYSGSNLPGEGGTIVYAGHNDLVFNKLKDIKSGDDVLIQTHYGSFRYRVFETKIINGDNDVALKPRGEKALLIMYTCYPLDLLGLTADRYVVFAEQVLDYPLARAWDAEPKGEGKWTLKNKYRMVEGN